jgi:starvation-inducible DNA-binding protein
MNNQKQIQSYLSNLVVFNVKLHNLHWNVEGHQFFQMHTKTQELYEALFIQFDDVAELLKTNQVFPLASVKAYLENATIKELDSKVVNVDDLIKVVIEDLTLLSDQASEIRNKANEANDFTTTMMFEGIVGEFKKNLWFFNAL